MPSSAPQWKCIVNWAQDFSRPYTRRPWPIELDARGVSFEREKTVPVSYKGELLACGYRADFVCFGAVLVELKATTGLTVIDQAQLLNYLKATGLKKGMLLNFGTRRLEYKRLVS
jgi:GxxExxY protein